MRRYPTRGKGRISEALHVEHGMIQNNSSHRAAPAASVHLIARARIR
jgi:hypothetical protein